MSEEEIYEEIGWLIETNYSVLNDTFYLSILHEHLEIKVPKGYYICFTEFMSTEDIRLAPRISPEQLN